MTRISKAVFLDRDGVINEMVYHSDHGIIDSPFTVEQFKLITGAGEAIRMLREKGYKVVLISNQPGIAKGHMSQEMFEDIRNHLKRKLAENDTYLDAEYYCQHHPEAKIEAYKINCDCRKPKPGLIIQAAKDLNIDLSQSWMVGDGLTDIMAGKSAGVKTILLARMKCELCHMMDDINVRPDAITSNVEEAAKYIINDGNQIDQIILAAISGA